MQLALLCTAALASVGAYVFLVQPKLARAQTLRRIIPVKQRELHQLSLKAQQYRAMTAESPTGDPDAAKQERTALMPLLESLLDELDLTPFVERQEQIETRPDASTRDIVVEATLTGITFKQLVTLLAALERPQTAASIRSLEISTQPINVGRLDVDFELGQ